MLSLLSLPSLSSVPVVNKSLLVAVAAAAVVAFLVVTHKTVNPPAPVAPPVVHVAPPVLVPAPVLPPVAVAKPPVKKPAKKPEAKAPALPACTVGTFLAGNPCDNRK